MTADLLSTAFRSARTTFTAGGLTVLVDTRHESHALVTRVTASEGGTQVADLIVKVTPVPWYSADAARQQHHDLLDHLPHAVASVGGEAGDRLFDALTRV